MTGAAPVAEVVIASSDVDATAAFLALFGLTERSDHPDRVPAALTAADGAVRLASPAAPARATVLVVPAGESPPGEPPQAWQRGPRALDLYTDDLDRGVARAHAAGFEVSPAATLSGGPMLMRQARVTGPDSLPVVLVQSTHRRSSVLDSDPELLHSEPHSVVWCVNGHEAEVERWVGAGWTAGVTISFSEPTVSDELDLPERPTPITMTMLSNEAVDPIRVELLTFDHHEDPAPPAVPRAGLRGIVIEVPTIPEAVEEWGAGARFDTPERHDDGTSSAAGMTIGGVRLLLVERAR